MNFQRLKIAVGIATAGRRDLLFRLVDLLSHQTRLPDALVVCPLPADDISPSAFKGGAIPTTVLSGPTGSSAQRNVIFSVTEDADLIVFFDDDFLPSPDYLEKLEELFLRYPDVSGATGFLLADGVKGPGLSFEEGAEIIKSHPNAANEKLDEILGVYGCNMAFRMKDVNSGKLRFDENLPLYGWQEDIDFSLQIARFGRIVKSGKLLGVHLGVKAGRTSGMRFGYSQVVNPIYLHRKGTMPFTHANKLMWRNIFSNFTKSFRPEPWVDRRGRLHGNLLGLRDVILGRASPRNILKMDR